MLLSEETKKILRQYGWSPERKVDAKPFVDGLKAEGYVVFERAVEFLGQYGGLYLKMPQYRGSGWDTLHFDAILAAGRIFIDNVWFYEGRVGEKLVPVGEAYNGHYVLMLSESGKMYGAYDDLLRLAGQDCEDAIESMYRRLETPKIP